MVKMGTWPYYIYSKNVREIAESTSEYQFKEKEALEGNDSGPNEFCDEESPAMADDLWYSCVFSWKNLQI